MKKTTLKLIKDRAIFCWCEIQLCFLLYKTDDDSIVCVSLKQRNAICTAHTRSEEKKTSSFFVQFFYLIRAMIQLNTVEINEKKRQRTAQ